MALSPDGSATPAPHQTPMAFEVIDEWMCNLEARP